MATSSVNSKVGVCNLALIQLKQELVTDIDAPVSQSEKLCHAVYDQVRLSTLRSHPWNFAIRRRTLTKDSVVPEFGFSARYLFPSDFVRYLNRTDESGAPILLRESNYQIEGGHLLLNSDGPINLRYIYDHTDITKWDELAIQVLALSIAVAIAPNFTSRETRIDAIKKDRQEVMDEARAIDGQERPPIRTERSRFRQARRGGRMQANTAGPFMVFES